MVKYTIRPLSHSLWCDSDMIGTRHCLARSLRFGNGYAQLSCSFHGDECNAAIYNVFRNISSNTATCLYTLIFRPIWASASLRSLVLYYRAVCLGPCKDVSYKLEDGERCSLFNVGCSHLIQMPSLTW